MASPAQQLAKINRQIQAKLKKKKKKDDAVKMKKAVEAARKKLRSIK